MRLIDDVSREALGGSRPADGLVVWAWRGGSLVVPEPLDVVSWKSADNVSDSWKVSQRLSLVVADPDGSLSAWRVDDPLGVAGTRLHVAYRVGGAGAPNFGRFRIVSNTPTEVVESRVVDEYGYMEPDGSLPMHKRRVWSVRAVVEIEAVDMTADVDDDKFESPESPPLGATVWSEFRRLTERHFLTVFAADVPDVPVSSRTVFERERLEAAQDVLKRVGARYRMDGDGVCQVYMPGGDPVLRIEPETSLVSVERSQSSAGLYNRWVVEGKELEDGRKIVAAVSIDSGPLEYGGNHGRKPFFYSSSMIESWEQAYQYAEKLRTDFLASLSVELRISTTPRPELQAGDRVEVGCPIAAGHVVYFPGEITSIDRAGDKAPRETTMTVAVAYSEVERALETTPWAEHMTRTLPPLTWDRFPGTWGTAPLMAWDDLP